MTALFARDTLVELLGPGQYLWSRIIYVIDGLEVYAIDGTKERLTTRPRPHRFPGFWYGQVCRGVGTEQGR